MNITTDQKGQLWLLQQPAGRPPPGVIPNFDNPSNLDAAVYSIIILSCSIAVLATMIRIYTKIFLIRLLVYEDCESWTPSHAQHNAENDCKDVLALASVSPFFPPSDGKTLKGLDHDDCPSYYDLRWHRPCRSWYPRLESPSRQRLCHALRS